MITAAQDMVIGKKRRTRSRREKFRRDEGAFDVELMRQKINSEEYLNEAIQRLALILTNELLGISPGGFLNEQRRKRR